MDVAYKPNVQLQICMFAVIFFLSILFFFFFLLFFLWGGGGGCFGLVSFGFVFVVAFLLKK